MTTVTNDRLRVKQKKTVGGVDRFKWFLVTKQFPDKQTEPTENKTYKIHIFIQQCW